MNKQQMATELGLQQAAELNQDALLNQAAVLEQALVAQDLRGMARARAALTPGYLQRAAALLYQPGQHVLICTGFPIKGTFETDGPVGAVAIYRMLQAIGAIPVLVCDEPLYAVLAPHYRTALLRLTAPDAAAASAQATQLLTQYQPAAIVCIERPGQAADGRYYNMRHQDISAWVADVDTLVRLATCPTVGIGDGGNEIGMGNIATVISTLNIRPAHTCCTELIVADVSNWAAYGLAYYWSCLSGQDLFGCCDPTASLAFFSAHGSVDGVTGHNTLTEDGLPTSVGVAICHQFHQLYLQQQIL